MDRNALLSGAAVIGSAAAFLGSGRFNLNSKRPWIGPDGLGRIASIVNGKTVALATNAPALLQYDEWKDIDRQVIEVATQRLTGIADLIDAGLTHTLGSIGQTIALWERSSDMTPAQVSMDGMTRSEQDTVSFDTQQVPVPIVHKDFPINLRRLEASRRAGESVDVITSDLAARVVAEKSEDMLFSTSAVTVDGGTIYGYTSHPNRNTVALPLAWTNGGKTGLLILVDVQAMLAAARADNFYGPFTLYIPAAYEGVIDNDFSPGTSDNRTIRERIMQLSGIADIKVADRMPANNLVLVQMTREVVDMAIAQDITTVQWEVNGGMQQQFKVMCVWVPRVKSDYDGKSGIVHMS